MKLVSKAKAALLGVALAIVGCLGCGYQNPRPAFGPGPAHATVVTYWHVIDGRPRKRSIITITNPTDEDVILDCNKSRTRVKAHTEVDTLGGRGCDLQNDVTYSPNTSIQ